MKHNKFQVGSLENVSSNHPWGGGFSGDFEQQEQSTLKRSRSLALSREDILFGHLDISTAETTTKIGAGGAGKQRRSQLIPRAKLIDHRSNSNHHIINSTKDLR